jgi:hypothetical protein
VLDTAEYYLWPQAAVQEASKPSAAGPSDRLAAYAGLGALDAPDWKQMIRDASDHVELLGSTLGAVLETGGLAGLLAAKAANGCQVRILVSDPAQQLAPYLDRDGIEIRVLDAPAHQTVLRFDQQLFLLLELSGEDAPLLHVRRASTGGLFDRLTRHYEDCWERASQPIDPDLDTFLDADEEIDNGVEPQQSARADRTARIPEAPPATPPRRWPRRPT